MPISGLTEKRRLPRLGKIRIGEKVANASGSGEHPKALDYFSLNEKNPPELNEAFKKIYGDKPKSLKIVFPVENDAVFASQWYKAYSNTRGLICKGDGVKAWQLVDLETGTISNRDSREVTMKEVVCKGQGCSLYQEKRCSEVLNLQFLLPDVPGIGVWQIDSGSYNSIVNINSQVELVRSVIGHIAGVSLDLVLEPMEVTADGRKKTVHVLNLKLNKTLKELTGEPKLQIEAPASIIPEPDDAPDDNLPDEDELTKVFGKKPDDLTDVLNVDWGKETQKDFLNMLVQLSIKAGWLPDVAKRFINDRFKIADSRSITIAMRNAIIGEVVNSINKVEGSWQPK